MTGKTIKKLFGELKNERLNAQERGMMRLTLLQLVRKTALVRHIDQESVRPKLSFISLMTRRLTSMPAIIIAIIIALSGGVSAAAQHSLPGDVLFPVKVEINDHVKLALAFSPEAKANVETRIAQQRLEEAEELSAGGKLSADVSADLKARFEAYAARVEARIAAMKEKGKADAALEATNNFEASLRAHEAILARLQAKSAAADEAKAEGAVKPEEKSKADVEVILKSVRARTESVVKEREDSEADVSAKTSADVQAAAEGKMNAAANKIAEVKAFYEAKKAQLSADERAAVEAKLAAADKEFADAKAKLEAKAYAEAFVGFQKAARTAQEAKLMTSSSMTLDLGKSAEESPGNPGEANGEAETHAKVEIHVGR